MAKHTIEFKKKVIEHFKKYGAAETIRVYNVSKRSVYYWTSEHESGCLMRKEKETYSPEKKLEIIEYYRENRAFETEKQQHVMQSMLL